MEKNSLESPELIEATRSSPRVTPCYSYIWHHLAVSVLGFDDQVDG